MLASPAKSFDACFQNEWAHKWFLQVFRVGGIQSFILFFNNISVINCVFGFSFKHICHIRDIIKCCGECACDESFIRILEDVICAEEGTTNSYTPMHIHELRRKCLTLVSNQCVFQQNHDLVRLAQTRWPLIF